MDERQARATTLLEAYEMAPGPSWSEEDRRWADRVAVEAVEPGAAADRFVAERARHALHRLLPREPAAARWLARPSRFAAWLLGVGLLAFIVGAWPDPFAGSQRINLLAPPLWGVLAWNVVVYAWLAVSVVAAALGLGGRPAGWLRRAVERRLAGGERDDAAPAASAAPATPAAAPAHPLRQAATVWRRHGARLAGRRAAVLLHLGAALLGMGLIGGLYLRGIALDYRVGWQSTFLSVETVHALLASALAPAASLSGLPLPDVAAVGALRHGPAGASEPAGAPAAVFIHLLALTVVLVVVAPRLLLAALAGAALALRRRRFPLPLDTPYFERLVRLQRGADAEIVAVPYAQTPGPRAALALQALVGEAFGPKARLRVAPTASFAAGDDAVPAALLSALAGASHAVVLCDLGATPEAESHGRFVGALAARLPASAPLALVVDEAAFRRRFAGLEDRLAQRRDAWRRFAQSIGVPAVFADLEATVTAADGAALQAAFSHGGAVAAPGTTP